MKVPLLSQQKLLEVQAIDTTIAQCEHRQKSLPEHAEIAAGQKKRRVLSENIVALQTRLADLEVALAAAEEDLIPVRERKARNQTRVDEGAADPKALQALIDEIGNLGRRIETLEDAQLELMEQLELVQGEKQALGTARTEVENGLRKLMAARDEQTAVIETEIAAAMTGRNQIAAELPSDFVVLYDKIRARAGGIGAAKLKGKRCQGCQLEATASAVERYLNAAADDVLRCEECDRILVRES
ncbi:MAG: hypothetical protein FWG47_03790 [Propionibacteriaceae bacterium]|nr:hypothetical protein [Propionibacteriaceae bacterium]